ncbi:MAG: arginine deiminase [Ezakiella sp.]|nr:arginine deiminase [Ezakiella sp.]MDD7471737.1 arginine deiminase [Bacillota bacterium]MDY3922933.1 arginine deiminase [Ezakiella sp.]
MIKVYSEIGPLKKVILKRPGNELLNLVPEMLEELLFDEIPFLEDAQAEHDAFANIFRKNGCEVYYLEDLAGEAIKDEQVKYEFIDEFISEAHVVDEREVKYLKDMLNEFEGKELIERTMSGIRREEMPKYEPVTLYDFLKKDDFFITKPMPNLYFTRDPFALMGSGVSLNKMWSDIRNRETIYGKYIFKYHDEFKNSPFYYDRNNSFSIEGGDELVLSKDCLAIGISQRTSPKALETFAKNALTIGEFKKVLALAIPKKRAFMHLDTVFTMIDVDKFTVHPEIEGPLEVFEIVKDGDNIKVTHVAKSLEKLLSDELERDVKLIRCAGANPIDSRREQWSDGSNTLAIKPGEVVVYDRNNVTNEILDKEGIKLHVMKSGELSRGRGGPRCMSMPVIREDI